jgi:protein SCO1/2
MNSGSKSLQIIVWGSMVLTIVGIAVAYMIKGGGRQRSAPSGIELRQDGAGSGTLPVLFEVPDFALTNQTGKTIGRADLSGKVWIADIIFSRCAGPCPEMTRRMAELQAAISPQSPVSFVTLTTDPLHDTPPVLLAYSRRYAAQAGRWHFLTGTPKQIADLAIGGLKLTVLDKEAAKQVDPNDLFIHSTIFVVVDKKGRARAVIESDEPAMRVKALGVIQRLLEEQ